MCNAANVIAVEVLIICCVLLSIFLCSRVSLKFKIIDGWTVQVGKRAYRIVVFNDSEAGEWSRKINEFETLWKLYSVFHWFLKKEKKSETVLMLVEVWSNCNKRTTCMWFKLNIKRITFQSHIIWEDFNYCVSFVSLNHETITFFLSFVQVLCCLLVACNKIFFFAYLNVKNTNKKKK